MKTRIAYLKAVNGIPIEAQRRMAKAAGCEAVFEAGDVAGKDSRALWMLRLHPDAIAYVPRLDCLAKRRSELGNVRVGSDLSATVMAIMTRGIEIEDGANRVTSSDPRFAAVLQKTLQGIHNSSRDPEVVASGLVKARKVRSDAGTVVLWKSDAYADKRDRQRTIWQSSRFTSDEDAVAALHPDLRHLSASSIRRIFEEGRRPALKGVGGRKPQSPASRCRFVYVASIKGGSKVGIAKDVERRRERLKFENCDNVKMVKWWELADPAGVESLVKYRMRRERSDWSHERFTLSTADLIAEVEKAILDHADGVRIPVAWKRMTERRRDKAEAEKQKRKPRK